MWRAWKVGVTSSHSEEPVAAFGPFWTREAWWQDFGPIYEGGGCLNRGGCQAKLGLLGGRRFS